MPGGRPRKQPVEPAPEPRTRRRRGTGSLRIDEKTGRAYALDRRNEHGHRESYEGVGPTLDDRARDAERWLDERVAARARAAGLLPETVGDFLERWVWETYRAAPFTTLANMRTRLARAAPIADLLLAAVTRDDIDRLVTDLQAEGLAPRYVRLIRSALRAAFARAVEMGRLAENPVTVRPRVPIRIPARRQVVWDADATKLFLAEVSVSPRWPLWLLAVSYGLRQGELRALRWDDINLRTRKLTVRRTLRRGRREGDTKSHVEREIALLPEIAEELRTFRSSPWTTPIWVFSARPPAAMTSDDIAAELTLLVAGINASYPPEDGDPPRLADLTPHGLRHTAATLMLRRGVPVVKVSQILGHSRPSITWDMYGWALPSDDDLLDQAVRANLF
jgi:integrase